jgi:nucleotide-binding universal stress UspA family protein
MADISKPRTILVPVDESEASIQAFGRALALAVHTGARVRIFHALVHAADVRDDDESRRVWLERARNVTGASTQAVDIGYMSHPDRSAFDGIVSACEESRADLVVMGTHGGGLLSASVAQRLVGRAPCNVMVCHKDARGEWPVTPGTILVPVDLSDNSLRAVRYARAIALDQDRLTVLHVVSTPDHPDVRGADVPTPLHAEPELEERVERRLRGWLGDSTAEVVAVEGDVVSSILDHAHDRSAALVVMGTRGLTGFARFVVGSVAEHITRSCEAPVVTVR